MDLCCGSQLQCVCVWVAVGVCAQVCSCLSFNLLVSVSVSVCFVHRSPHLPLVVSLASNNSAFLTCVPAEALSGLPANTMIYFGPRCCDTATRAQAAPVCPVAAGSGLSHPAASTLSADTDTGLDVRAPGAGSGVGVGVGVGVGLVCLLLAAALVTAVAKRKAAHALGTPTTSLLRTPAQADREPLLALHVCPQ
jgi:hypothetical protein